MAADFCMVKVRSLFAWHRSGQGSHRNGEQESRWVFPMGFPMGFPQNGFSNALPMGFPPFDGFMETCFWMFFKCFSQVREKRTRLIHSAGWRVDVWAELAKWHLEATSLGMGHRAPARWKSHIFSWNCDGLLLSYLSGYLHIHTLHCIALHCIALHCITVHSITLHYTYVYIYTYIDRVNMSKSWFF